MKNITILKGEISDKSEELKVQSLKVLRERDPQASLTQMDIDEINKKLREFVNKEIVEDQPTADPNLLVSVYKAYTPLLSRTTKKEEAERRIRRQNAARAYADGFMAMCSYSPEAKKYGYDRGEQRIQYILEPEERADFARCKAGTKEQYYKDQNLTPEEVNNRIQANRKAVALYHYKAVRRTLDQFGDILSADLTDDQLIQEYPRIANAMWIVEEGVGLLQDTKQYSYEEIPEVTMKMVERQLDRLMVYTPVLEKRISTLADPNYPYVRLEAFQQEFPERIQKMIDQVDFYGDLEDKQENKELIVTDQTDPLPAGADRRTPKYTNRIRTADQIRSMASNAQFTNRQLLTQRIADAIGLTEKEMKKDALISDKDGKTMPFDESTFSQMLTQNGGEIYVMSKRGSGTPVPVLLDLGEGTYNPLVGMKAIRAAQVPELRKPTISWISLFFSGIMEWAVGHPSSAKEKYDKDLKAYEKTVQYLENRSRIQEKPLPEALIRTNRELQIEGRKEEYHRTAANDLELLRHLDKEKDMSAFDRSLGHLLAAKALSSPKGDKFREAMSGILGAYAENYNEKNAINVFRDSKPFAEFTGWLRKTHSELLDQLQSMDSETADKGLTEIGRLFRENRDQHVALVEENRKNGVYQRQSKESVRKNKEKTVAPEGELLTGYKRDLMGRERGNQIYWDDIRDLCGPVRKLRPEWTEVCANDNVYGVENWQRMRKADIDLEEYRPEGKALDERTFSSLVLLLSQRRNHAFTPELMGEPRSGHATMVLEDLFGGAAGPRAGTHHVLEPFIEPSRAKLLGYLKGMGEEDGPTGKRAMAKAMAEPMHLLACRLSTMDMSDRKNAAMAEMCSHIMEFVHDHGMEKKLLEQGLPERELESLRITCALGKIACEGFDAADELILGEKTDAVNRDKQTDSIEKRRELLDKAMLLHAVQAVMKGGVKRQDLGKLHDLHLAESQKDMAAHEEDLKKGYIDRKRCDEWQSRVLDQSNARTNADTEDYLQEYPSMVRNLLDADPLKGREALRKLSYEMMSEERRQELLQANTLEKSAGKALYDERQTHPLVDKWEKAFQRFRKLEERLGLMDRMEGTPADKKKLDDLSRSIRTMIKDASPNSKLILSDLSEDDLFGPQILERMEKQRAKEESANQQPEQQLKPRNPMVPTI